MGKVGTTHSVIGIDYQVHIKRGDLFAPKSLQVEYKIALNLHYKEWVCFEHEGYPREKAEAWWRARSNVPSPVSVAEAIRRIAAGDICETKSITVHLVPGEPRERIIDYELGEKPIFDVPF